MVICPIAIAVGCKKCPVFKVCPLTTLIGDQKTPSAADNKPAAKPATKQATKPAKKTTPASKKKR